MKKTILYESRSQIFYLASRMAAMTLITVVTSGKNGVKDWLKKSLPGGICD